MFRKFNTQWENEIRIHIYRAFKHLEASFPILSSTWLDRSITSGLGSAVVQGNTWGPRNLCCALVVLPKGQDLFDMIVGVCVWQCEVNVGRCVGACIMWFPEKYLKNNMEISFKSIFTAKYTYLNH